MSYGSKMTSVLKGMEGFVKSGSTKNVPVSSSLQSIRSWGKDIDTAIQSDPENGQLIDAKTFVVKAEDCVTQKNFEGAVTSIRSAIASLIGAKTTEEKDPVKAISDRDPIQGRHVKALTTWG